jgi:hypothetical protein
MSITLQRRLRFELPLARSSQCIACLTKPKVAHVQTSQSIQHRHPTSPTVVVRRQLQMPFSRPQIDLSDRDNVKRWCREFGTTQLHLFSTVDRVGNDVDAVRNALRIR